ncbi:gamma-glutamylcyclotransferase family protein [Acuticoccus sp. MNP-M23]|mgnify:CR=1 FL=1|uniref:gamma-glutamylcyclotransferase family protein n=1 Tax=Acuticoccus sp. MNP-M23 TaxID=3072793 RepID=UPI002815C900|nr:gamma-glutamylcyclotransferase family protein [Acuticoccus sp. MNP-M23]WMS44432.1 gamma-glutamylcyclotransferase family protein [Acuticoccus sp. MNP-M23]
MMIVLRRFLKRLWLPVILRVWPLARLWYWCWGLRLDGHPADKVWYFAFGANMNDSVFLGRRRMKPLEWRVGRAPGYRLRFNLHGRPRGKSAPANIAPDPEEEVWGVLYRMTRRDMVRLHSTEGVPGWRYYPVWLDVADRDGNPLRAFSLIADGLPEDGNPSLRYISLIREGAIQHDLPDHWLDKLNAVRHAETAH